MIDIDSNGVWMVDQSRDNSNALDVVDKAIEKDRLAAALVAKAHLEKDVILVVSQIDKSCEISLARIISESEISITKITANAEIASARLGAQSELIEREIDKLRTISDDSDAYRIAVSMISETSKNQGDTIASEAKKAVADIRLETENAIAKIQQQAQDAIDEINDIKTKSGRDIQTAARRAENKLTEYKKKQRTAVQTIIHADIAAKEVLNYAASVKTKLTSVSDNAIARIEAMSEKAHHRLMAACDEATERIEAARNRAIQNLQFTHEGVRTQFK